jgi:hypothetical protein
MFGDIAEGGGELTVVSDVELVFTSLRVVESVYITFGSVVVSCATATLANITEINKISLLKFIFSSIVSSNTATIYEKMSCKTVIYLL